MIPQALFIALARGRLTVLGFHKVPRNTHALVPDETDLAGFEKVLTEASRRFRFLPLDEAILALRAGNLPDRAACITFDDGYADWLHGVVPVLERQQLHATFFVTSGQFTGPAMWNERILHAITEAPAGLDALQLSLPSSPSLSLLGAQNRRHAVAQLDRFLKYQEPQTKEDLLQELESLTGVDPAQAPRMSVDDLRAIHSRGFGIGGHSVTHPILSRCTSEQAYQEIAQSREQLEGLIGGPVSSFAYPNGEPGVDFSAEHVAMVQRAGYRSALTTDWGAANGHTPVFQIPRFTPWGPSSLKMDVQFTRNFFHRPQLLPPAPTAKKKVLMVAFHFPPQAGSSGVLRTLNFVKNLGPLGWTPAVLSANPKAYVEQRNDLVNQIPLDTPVSRAFALDTARHLSIAGKYPRGLALPDRWSSWWFGGVFQGMRWIRRDRPDLLWSTYPISTAHAIAGTMARWSGLPWVADFRDPMVSQGYPSDRVQRWVWERIEAGVLRRASACIFTTERAAA
uniref:polysaccharide deacetylase family protein n=1 Tax=Hydrogenophaga sp. TaxID=1904254 RepID=UPI0035638FA4